MTEGAGRGGGEPRWALDHGRRGPWHGRATVVGAPQPLSPPFLRVLLRPENLSHRENLTKGYSRLCGVENTREKRALRRAGIRRGNSLPEGEIDAIVIVIELDITSIIIIIIIIISTIYTVITTAAPRHRCNNLGISMNEVRKKLFTISLSGKAAHWYKLLKNGDSIDWEDIVPLFYSKFYPPSEIHKDRNRIYNFWPHDGESIAQAWGRLKSLMLKCPIHELPGNVIIDNFYARLSFQDKTLLDTSCSGSFTRNKEELKRDLLDRIQENTEGWENDKDRESAYIEKTPFPAKMKEYSVISSAVNKSEKKPKEPEEQIKIEPVVAIVKDLVTENVEDGHIIFCEDASNIVSNPNKPKQVSVPMLSVRIGDHCYYGLCDIGASVSAIPYELYTEIMHEIGSCELEDIDVVIHLANRETISPIGIVRDVEVLCGEMKSEAEGWGNNSRSWDSPPDMIMSRVEHNSELIRNLTYEIEDLKELVKKLVERNPSPSSSSMTEGAEGEKRGDKVSRTTGWPAQPLSPPFLRTPSSENLSHGENLTKGYSRLCGAENTREKELSAGRNPREIPSGGEIDAIVIVIELDITSIIIIIIISTIYTVITTAAPRHRCNSLGWILIV
ncbi:hypothetical protein QYE76_044579 [Lolium multiflorum]|uniref:Retrotransposon gag domain-containing protein n=1 Tax=Lolium multiflorum TaxID=4521 RepID=A0AAD8WZ05_LOLMU|nr:hypothetical protein QYE76_044579 [Lolium multiflorum]